jgi:hypothetical protein
MMDIIKINGRFAIEGQDISFDAGRACRIEGGFGRIVIRGDDCAAPSVSGVEVEEQTKSETSRPD